MSVEPMPADLWMTLSGARGALERLRAAGASHQAVVPAAEATYWICAADEGIGTRADPGDRYPAGGAELIAGHRYARNGVTHELLLVTKLAGGITFPLRFPLVSNEHLRWEAREELLPPLRSSPQRRAYLARVAGRSPVETLSEALELVEDAVDRWRRQRG